MSNGNSSRIVFLLGAGASVKAGVPDTFSFVRDFQQSIQDRDEKRTVTKIIDTLKKWQGANIDVELLLEILTKLSNMDEEPILRFIEGGKFILSGFPQKRPIIGSLKDFIRSKAIIRSQEKIRYLEPLLGFVEEYRPLDIISVNYDTCIEQFCSVYQLNYQDGFDISWNPSVFERENNDIRLYKLHGSVIWYKSDRAGYMKLPVMQREAGIRLITGERAESLMLYPMQKFDYAEPLLELLLRVKNLIQDENCKFLVVAGYSFRDEHITRIVLDVARRNTNINIIIVDPKAYQIYRNKLKYFNISSRIPSSLDGRVICLPYKFEDALPYLKDHYIKNLRDSLSIIALHTNRERIGEQISWVDSLKPLVNAEHVEKVEELIGNKVTQTEIDKDWQIAFEIPLKMYINMSSNGHRSAKKYLSKFLDFCRRILIDELKIQVARAKNTLLFTPQFGWKRVDSGSASNIPLTNLKDLFKDLYQYILSRSKMTKTKGFTKEIEFMNRIIQYLDTFEDNEYITYTKFSETRGAFITDLKGLSDMVFNWMKDDDPETLITITDIISKTEKRAISYILKISK